MTELVGRDDVLGQVRRVVDDARHGTGTSLLVGGVSGIGKSSLLRAALADAVDVEVAWGTCVEAGGAPGFWPWTQALSGLVRRLGPERARAAAGGDVGLLAAIVPTLGDREPAGDPTRSRMLLLDAALAWLHELAATRPLVVVLDDLQWADESSLALLELVTQDPRRAGLSLVGAYRDDEVPRDRAQRWSTVVARVEHLRLPGLSREAAATLVASTTGAGVSPETADALFARTGGHPFFLRELALAAAAGMPDDRVPVAVREAVERRVRLLAPATLDVLQVAATAGATLQPDVIAAVTERSDAEVERAIDEGVQAGVLVRGRHGVRFEHDLFRETLAAMVEPAARSRLHLALGHALEDRLGRAADVAPSDLARHFRGGVRCGGLDRAVVWALRAAEAERSSLAMSEAVDHLRRLRAEVADVGLSLADEDLVDVLLAEADALSRLGGSPDAAGLVRAARAAADRCGDLGRITRAALAAAALGSRFAARRDDVLDELESALAKVTGADDALEARLTAALARELQHSVAAQRARAGPLSERALALGRLTDDPDALADCLLARHDVLWTPGRAPERAEVAGELVELAQRAGDPEREAEALLLQANALLESGSAAFSPTLDRSLELLRALGQPRHRYTVSTREACVALMRGRLDEATAHIEEAFRLGERLREPDAGNVRMSQQLELVRARGDAAELLAFADEAVAHWTGAPVHAHAVAAGFCSRAGDLDRARHHVAAVHDVGGWRSDRSYLWSVFVRELAAAAVALDDRELCRELLEETTALAGSCGVNGAVVAFAGCHSHTAGRLAAALGDRAGARALLDEAVEVYARLGAVVAVSEARQDVLAVDGRPAADRPSLHRRGPVWDVAYAGRTATVPHCKGLQDIAELVRRPLTDVHALDLVGSRVVDGAGDEQLDRSAVVSYRRRLAELSEARTEAEEAGDVARLGAVDDEHDALVAELSAGTGLGGRSRPFVGSASERARKAVSARVRDAIRRIGEVLPDLARHLDQNVVTGVECRYRAGVDWDVRT